MTAVCKAALTALVLIGVGLGPALAQTGSQPERPYSVAQAPGLPEPASVPRRDVSDGVPVRSQCDIRLPLGAYRLAMPMI